MAKQIGARVADSMPEGLKQLELAARVGMTPDALSRSLRGERGFSSLEIARIADELCVDLHWLITGEPDPRQIIVAARHSFDHNTKRHLVPNWPSDSEILNDIELVYRQAEQKLTDSTQVLPRDPAELRRRLGNGFVRSLATRLESEFGIDVVRLPGLSTAYSFTVIGRRVIALPAEGNWFRENWSMGHEYCHLAEGHHEAGFADEPQANAFAAEALLPEALMRGLDWESMDAATLAQHVWEWGISTDALSRRLNALGIRRSTAIDGLLAQTTQGLLRRHWRQPQEEPGDAITLRMDAAASRRFPIALQQAHLELISAGQLDKASLAWMLGVDPDALEVEVPQVADVPAGELLEALGMQSGHH